MPFPKVSSRVGREVSFLSGIRCKSNLKVKWHQTKLVLGLKTRAATRFLLSMQPSYNHCTHKKCFQWHYPASSTENVTFHAYINTALFQLATNINCLCFFFPPRIKLLLSTECDFLMLVTEIISISAYTYILEPSASQMNPLKTVLDLQKFL